MTTDLEVLHSSASVEWISPPEIVEPMRDTMGGIDCDPASHPLSEPIIQASECYDAEDNGFVQYWGGRTFLNPPGGACDKVGHLVIKARTDPKTRQKIAACTLTGACGLSPGHKHEGVQSAAKAWWRLLAEKWVAGEVTQGWFVGFNADILQTTLELADEGVPTALDFPLVYPRTRVRYLKEKNGQLIVGEQPPRPSVLIYLPPCDNRQKVSTRTGWGGRDMQRLRECFADTAKWKVRL